MIDTKGNQVNIPELELLIGYIYVNSTLTETVKSFHGWRIAYELPEELAFPLK